MSLYVNIPPISGGTAVINTVSTGLTLSSGTITADLSTGKAGGQSVIGGTAASDTLTLSSTSHATKGSILLGTSAYDEVNNRLGLGTASPAATLHVADSALNNTVQIINSNATSGGLYFRNTVTTGQAVIYLDNNRGSFASYGGLLCGGATNSIGNLFGLSRDDRIFLFSDGASSNGLAIGTLTNDSLTLGTNNTSRLEVLGTGVLKFAAASFTANNAQVVTIGATGPNGIGTPGTAAKWLTFQDSAGTVSYVPCWQ